MLLEPSAEPFGIFFLLGQNLLSVGIKAALYCTQILLLLVVLSVCELAVICTCFVYEMRVVTPG